MNPLVRMLISFAIALAVHAIYWLVVYRTHRVTPTFWARSEGELRLRTTGPAWRRIFTAWILAFVAYAFVIEDSGEPFTWYWLQECLLKGDWIAVLIIATLLTLCEHYLARKRLAHLSETTAGPEEEPQPATPNA